MNAADDTRPELHNNATWFISCVGSSLVTESVVMIRLNDIE